MENIYVLAVAIKEKLVELAVDDKLPLDMTQLDEMIINDVIEEHIDPYASLGSYIIPEDDKTYKECFDAIMEAPDDEWMDNIEGFSMWQPLQDIYMVKDFIDDVIPNELLNLNS